MIIFGMLIFIPLFISTGEKIRSPSVVESSNKTYKNEVADTSLNKLADAAIEHHSSPSKVGDEENLSVKASNTVNLKASELSRPDTSDDKKLLVASSSNNHSTQSQVNVYQKKPMYVDASRLNVRNEPNKKGKVIWTLKRDQKVQVTNKDGNWLYIENSRFNGWVYGTYLTNSPTPEEKTVADKPRDVTPQLSTAQIKQILIDRSHAYYRGPCPCPYNTTSKGHSCGKRSAYSRPGGASPLCYASDVTAKMVSTYKARQ